MLYNMVLMEYTVRGVNMGVRGGGGSPSRSQTKCSRSQNYVFVYTRCFAKQTKYFRNSETDQTQTFELKICSNRIKQLRNNMKKYYQSKPAPRDEVSIYVYLYVTITCLHFYLEFRFCKVIHGWHSIFAKISNPQNHTQKCDECKSK